ncbi:MAG: Clp protease N-terminal domain-containing protein [Propioniciclava sp.]
MNLSSATLWANAVWREAARLRSSRIDLEHLYLGLIGLGGDAARLLGRHGISLASARARVEESQLDAGTPRGIDAATPLTAPRDPTDVDTASLPWSPQARATMNSWQKAPDTFAMLVGLLREPSGTVRELVAADGVLPNDLVDELKAGSADPLAPEPAPVDASLLSPPAWAYRIRRFVSAESAAVMGALSDPAFLAWWAYDPTHADASTPTRVRFHRRGRSIGVEYSLRRDAGTLTWLGDITEGAGAGHRWHYDTLAVTPAPGGSELERTQGSRPFGHLGRILAPVSGRLSRRGLLHSTAALTQTVAEYGPPT